jgi:hypothetical protein
MSDVIRGAEQTVIITGPVIKDRNKALRGWGQRMWTFPEVVLSKGDRVMVVTQRQILRMPKIHLADLAWEDKDNSRQLVEHFTGLHLSRLELVSIALKCLRGRRLDRRHAGDESYALMGLLRVRPMIDTTDSSLQAFARYVSLCCCTASRIAF